MYVQRCLWGETLKEKKEYEGYYEFLKDEVGTYRGKFDEIIYYVPEIFKLLTDLLNENIKKEDRLIISAALAYFVAPMDVIPEEIYGPYGYVDDIFICTFVLKEIAEKYGWGLLEKNWSAAEDVKVVIEDAYKKSKEAVEGKENEILGYVGLK